MYILTGNPFEEGKAGGATMFKNKLEDTHQEMIMGMTKPQTDFPMVFQTPLCLRREYLNGNRIQGQENKTESKSIPPCWPSLDG